MTISTELIFSLIIQLITVGIFIGTYKQTISFMQIQITELKEDMKQYNNILQRMIICEQSTKSAHKRIDDVSEQLHEHN